MQPGNETILISVDINSNNQRLTDLRKELILNKQAVDELNRGFKDGRVSIDTLAEGQQKASVTAKQITGEIALLTKANAQQTVANQAAAGSTEQLRAQYGLAVASLNKLTTEERENTAAGQKLQATTKAMSDELKRQEAAYGSTGRSVGDYNKGVKDVNVVNGQLTGGLKTAVSQGLAPFQSQLDRGTGLFTKFRSGSDLVKAGLASIKGAGEEGSLGLKAIGIGIGLTGIGLFVIALSAVVSYFTSTNEGGKILKQGLAALGAVVTSVANTFTGAGKALVQAFKEPKVALESLMDFLKGQVVNRLAAFGLLIDGIRNQDFKKITDSVLQFGLGVTNGTDKLKNYAKGIGNAATNARDLEAQFQALKKSRAGLEADEILEKGRVEVLIRLSKDRTLSASDRLGKLREAGRLEGELSAKSLQQTTAELNAFKARNAARGLSRTADEIQEERDKQKEYNTTLVERNSTLATIKARQSRFILEERAELLKDQKERASAAQTAREQAVKAQQTTVEQQLLTVAKGTQAEIELLKRKIDLTAQLVLASDKKLAGDRKLLLSTAEVEKKRLQDEFDQKQAAAAKIELKRKYDESLLVLEEYLDKQRLETEKSRAAGEIDEKTFQNRSNLQTKAGLAAKLVLAREYKQSTAAIEKQITAEEIGELRKRTAAQEAAHAKQLATAETFGSELGALFASSLNETGNTLEAFAGKVLILILDSLEKQVLAQQAAATAAALAQPDSVATFGATGLIRAGIINALITAAFEGAKSVIGQTTKKGFATGGYVSGAGTGTSDSIPAMLSNGESVMNANTTASFAPLLSYLNQLGGGVGFNAPASSAGRLNDGGMSARHAGAGLFPSAAEIGAAVAANVPTSIGVRDINVAQGRAARVRQLTKLG